MATQYIRTKQAINTGLALEVTEGTAVTLAQANFTGLWTSDLIAPKATVNPITAGGDTGTTLIVQGKRYGELGNFSTPVCTETEANIFKAAGAIFSHDTTNKKDYYDFGGPSLDLSQDDVVSTASLTLGQYDGKEYYQLSGARPSSLKISGKSGAVATLDATFQGNFSKTNSTISIAQVPPTVTNPNAILGNTLTIGGTSFDFTDFELDFKLDLKPVESGLSTTGYIAFPIVNLDPTFTISLYPGDPATADLWNMFLGSDAPMALSWSFGSLVGNTYTVSALVQMDTQESAYNNDIQQRKITLKAVYNSATTYKLRIAVTEAS